MWGGGANGGGGNFGLFLKNPKLIFLPLLLWLLWCSWLFLLWGWGVKHLFVPLQLCQ